MSKIFFLGECMVELRGVSPDTMGQSFAGDIYNSAVYLKRCFPDIYTSLITVVGRDTLSNKMLERFETQALETDLVFRHETRVPGIYLIETDNTGEKHFTYWRSEAAARTVTDYMNDQSLRGLVAGDILFFSGISLAILEPQSRNRFWEQLARLRETGVKIAFDPNYRARLWSTSEQAKAEFERAFSVSDIAMPGVEDFTSLYGIKTLQGVLQHCRTHRINEVVVKNGPDSVITQVNNETVTHQITPVEHVVDTTSAGDAFNGVYLGARLSGFAPERAVQVAAKAAGTVIQHPGAIVPKASFDEAMGKEIQNR